jgi:hypothetical protein
MDGRLLNSQAVYLNQLPQFSIDNTCYILYIDKTFSANTSITKYFNGVTVMNTLTKLAIDKKISAIFADGTSKMNLGVSTVVGLLNGVDWVPVEVAPFSRSSKLLADLAESAGRQVTQTDGDGTLLVRPAVLAEPVAEELPVVESEAVAWPDMTGEQRVEVIADDKVEVEQIASVQPVAEAPGLRRWKPSNRSQKRFNSWRQRPRPQRCQKLRLRRSMPRSALSFSQVHLWGSC